MTPQIALVLLMLTIVIVLFVTEWIPMEVVSLLVLGSVALTGLVSPGEALSGFSNPAVVTIWAVFILSGGLTRTGVGNVIGRLVLVFAGRREMLIVVVIMLTAGVMSAFMNNVAVAALMLPVVMDIARHTNSPPILVSDALRDNGLVPFRLFDYTPVGVIVMLTGIAFMTLIGRYLLPKRDVARESSTAGLLNLREQYELQERIFLMRVPFDSALAGRALMEIRLGSALGLHVLGIIRNKRTELAPDPSAVLQIGDRLIVEGRPEQMKELNNWRQLVIGKDDVGMVNLFSKQMGFVELGLSGASTLVGKTLYEIGFRGRFGANVLAIRRKDMAKLTNLQDDPLEKDDVLLVYGPRHQLESLREAVEFDRVHSVSMAELTGVYRLQKQLLSTRIPQDSVLIGKTLRESRLGDTLGMTVICIISEKGDIKIPDPEDHFQAGDHLMFKGQLDDLAILRGLEKLEIEREVMMPDISELESARVGLVEAVLSPHTTLEGKTLRQLHLREKYVLSVLAIWREGRAYRSDLRNMALRFGDALLLYGHREKLGVLGREPDFIVLTQAAQEAPRLEKARLSILILVLVLLPVILGLVPIYISTVVGAALMVLTRCLTMEEAYRFIEWKAVFLIAGMLPLGIALDKTGAAKFFAEAMVAFVGPFGPMAVMAGLVGLTFLATCFIPTAALVVLITPIVLTTSSNMGISPYALMMAVAVAASASFMTPISHPANVLVMGPGGYRFIDYLKVGVPLSILVLLVVMFVLPYFWPLALQ
jgi:di/tricarboxylate transporter